MIIFIAAHDKKLGIGNNGKLPWPSMKNDKERLHMLAQGKTLVMGERTYHDYRDYQKTYATRNIYVLSLKKSLLDDATVLNTIDDVLALAKKNEIWVLGGGNVFKQLLPYADKMYLTEIDGEFEADTFFPEYNIREWNVEAESHPADEENPYPYTFLTLTRRS